MRMHVVAVIAAASLAALLLGAPPLVVVTVAHGNLNGLAFGAALALLVVSCVLGVAAWVGGLIQAAGRSRWDWFVAVLLLGAPAALALDLTRPTSRPAAA